MKWLSTLILFISISAHAQYNVGVYVTDTLYNGTYGSIAFCTPSPDVTFVVDNSLFLNVSGLNYQIILTAVNGTGIGTPAYPNFQTGDTLPLYMGVQYPIFFPAGGSIQYIIQAFGTPLVNQEIYACDIAYLFTLGFCMNTNLFYADTMGPTCIVGTVGNEIPGESKILIYPNPVNDIIFLDGEWDADEYSILDMWGSVVHAGILKDSKQQIDISDISSGIYFIRIFKNGIPSTIKFIKARHGYK